MKKSTYSKLNENKIENNIKFKQYIYFRLSEFKRYYEVDDKKVVKFNEFCYMINYYGDNLFLVFYKKDNNCQYFHIYEKDIYENDNSHITKFFINLIMDYLTPVEFNKTDNTNSDQTFDLNDLLAINHFPIP